MTINSDIDSIKQFFANKLNNKIVIDKDALQYLSVHENLLHLLNTAIDKLQNYFNSKTTKYLLCHIYDPESQVDGLLLEIHTEQNYEESMFCLEKFEDEWWIDNMPDNPNQLVIDVMFE